MLNFLASILFIWMEIYHIRNKNILYRKVDSSSLNDIDMNIDKAIIFYIVSILYPFWMVSGFINHRGYLFGTLILLSVGKICLHYFSSNRDYYIKYCIIASYVRLATLFGILLTF